jgi:3-oxoacyl-[acyl-carrier-protein] synthase-3
VAVFSDLAQAAAERLLEAVGWAREEIDALIVVTQSPDYPIPATAIILQDRLKLSHATIAYDINLGCSGYPFGIYTLGSMLSCGGIKKALLLCETSAQACRTPSSAIVVLHGARIRSRGVADPIRHE